MFDLTIENGNVVLPDRVERLNIGIAEERIEKLSKTPIKAEEKIDAKKLTILPGLIDMHVHLREPGQTHKEDFFSGTCAAANGGFTTVVDMPNNVPSIDTVEKLQEKEKRVREKAIVDYGLYLGARFPEEVSKARLVKFYLSSSKDLLLSEADFEKCYSQLNGFGMVHAEDNDIINLHLKKISKPNFSEHGKIRPPEAELFAVRFINRMEMKHNRRLHVTHISTVESIEGLLPAITCDATPHHLFLNEKDVKDNYLKVNPPLRSKSEQQKLWYYLGSRINCISTDHAPHLPEEKERDYFSAPPGVPELDTFLSLFLTKINDKVIDMRLFTQICSQNPANILGLGNKGSIEVGKDADFVLVDMKKKGTIKSDNLQTKCGWTPYEGMKYKGERILTIVRGKGVFEEEALVRKWGKNQFLF